MARLDLDVVAPLSLALVVIVLCAMLFASCEHQQERRLECVKSGHSAEECHHLFNTFNEHEH